MRTLLKNLFLIGLLAVILCVLPMQAQTVSLTSTTTSAAITAAAREICLSSASGVVIPGAGTVGSSLFVGSAELMRINGQGSSATCFTVIRADQPAAWASGTAVYIGAQNNFRNYSPVSGSACVVGSMAVRPWIDTAKDFVWDCVASKYQVINGPAAAATGLPPIFSRAPLPHSQPIRRPMRG